MILTPEQIEAITKRCRCDGQRRELDHLGIPYRVRRDGSLVVLLRDVELPTAGSSIPEREPQLHL